FDAEKAALCCMFMDRDSAMLAKEMLASDDFYGMANRRVFEAACAVLNNGKELDVVTAVNYLKEHGWFEAVGGMSFIADIVSALPTTIGTKDYIQILLEKSQRRKYLEHAMKIK